MVRAGDGAVCGWQVVAFIRSGGCWRLALNWRRWRTVSGGVRQRFFRGSLCVSRSVMLAARVAERGGWRRFDWAFVLRRDATTAAATATDVDKRGRAAPRAHRPPRWPKKATKDDPGRPNAA
uniref:Uncharacterized protein n=1 Tax=Plectus sambesii TaxID=2011161 RepID=A0A914W9Z7_9BILA